MNKIFAAAAALLIFWFAAPVHACRLFVELGLDAADNQPGFLRGRNPLGVVQARCEFDSGVYVQIRHQSNLSDGPPFNNRLDDREQNSIGIFYRIELFAKR